MTFSLTITTNAQRLEAARAARLEALAALRWQRCCEGVSLANGVQVPGDEGTRLSISGAVSALQQGMLTEPVAWKTPTGFVALTQEEVEAAAAALVQHIQACFAAEAQVAAQIAASPNPSAFDISSAFNAALSST